MIRLFELQDEALSNFHWLWIVFLIICFILGAMCKAATIRFLVKFAPKRPINICFLIDQVTHWL